MSVITLLTVRERRLSRFCFTQINTNFISLFLFSLYLQQLYWKKSSKLFPGLIANGERIATGSCSMCFAKEKSLERIFSLGTYELRLKLRTEVTSWYAPGTSGCIRFRYFRKLDVSRAHSLTANEVIHPKVYRYTASNSFAVTYSERSIPFGK